MFGHETRCRHLCDQRPRIGWAPATCPSPVQLRCRPMVLASIVAAVAVTGLYNDARARQRDPRSDLVSVPIDGSRPPVALTPAALKNERVFDYAIAGGHVLYSRLIGSRLSLFSVPTDGSTQPITIADSIDNYPDHSVFRRLLFDGPKEAFWVSPDDAHVVLRTPRWGDNSLFSAPVDGSTAAIKLNDGGPNVFPVVFPPSAVVWCTAAANASSAFRSTAAPDQSS